MVPSPAPCEFYGVIVCGALWMLGIVFTYLYIGWFHHQGLWRSWMPPSDVVPSFLFHSSPLHLVLFGKGEKPVNQHKNTEPKCQQVQCKMGLWGLIRYNRVVGFMVFGIKQSIQYEQRIFGMIWYDWIGTKTYFCWNSLEPVFFGSAFNCTISVALPGLAFLGSTRPHRRTCQCHFKTTLLGRSREGLGRSRKVSEGLGSAMSSNVFQWQAGFAGFRSGVLLAQEHLVVESVRRYLELPRSSATLSDIEPKRLTWQPT